ncbi:MAG: Citrate synthase (si), partial [uncultured Sphingomonadaceae bacterium]
DRRRRCTEWGRSRLRRRGFRISGVVRHRRAGRHRHPQAVRQDGRVHLRSGLHLHRGVRVRDHLHRRGRGHPAPPRLPDRAAGGELFVHGGVLPAAQRRAAGQGRARPVRAHDLPPHDAARAARDLLPRLPARRASDGDHVRRGRRALGILPRFDRHHRSQAAHDRE